MQQSSRRGREANSHGVIGRGTIELLHPANQRVLAYLRHYEDQELLIVCNLSRFSQPVELDLRKYVGRIPIELFGESWFPPIGQLPYLLTLGPHGFYWFRLQRPAASS